jgi:hypothetical protein
MNTRSTSSSTGASAALPAVPCPSRSFVAAKPLLGAVCLSLVSFTAVPQAHAAKVNGSYDVKRTTGSVRFNGDEIDIPERLVRRIAGVVDGKITIRDRTLKIRKKGTVRIVEKLADELDVDVEVAVTGPSSVKLVKSGNTATGRTTRPVVTSFEAEVFDLEFSGELITRVKATVERKTLKIVVRFSGEAEGEDFSGRVTIIAKR